MEKLFEVAIRNKFRFNFRGVISTEDLWDLTVKQLDSVFKEINLKLKQTQEESLLDIKTKEDKELDMKIEIVKYVVKTKLEEAEIVKNAKESKEKKQKIMELISRKKDTELEGKTVEELEAML